VNAAFKGAAEGTLKGILGYEERPLVSVDFKDDPRDLLQMLAHGVKVPVVAGLPHGNVDRPAVLVEQEVMDRALLIEAHRLGAAR